MYFFFVNQRLNISVALPGFFISLALQLLSVVTSRGVTPTIFLSLFQC